MALNRTFQLTHFPNGTTDYSDRGFPNITNEYLVLMCQEELDGVIDASGIVPIGILAPQSSPPDYYRFTHTFADGSIVDVVFFGKLFSSTKEISEIGFSYNPTVLGMSVFTVLPIAKAYMDKNLGLSSGGSSGGTVDLSPVMSELSSVISVLTVLNSSINSFEGSIYEYSMSSKQEIISKIDGFGKYNLLDLNGQFGSYRNGTKVLISGHTEEYSVLSSSLIWDDKMGVLMLTYDLKNSKNEICPCSHPLLSLVPATTTTPTNGA